MISFLQKLRRTAAVPTGKQSFDPTEQVAQRSLVSKVFCEWPEDEPVRVEVALERFPQLRDSSRAIIELAIKEFNERRAAGENLSEADFAKRFPEIRSQLLDSLVFEKALMEMTGWFHSILAAKDDNTNWPKVGDQIAGFQLVEPLGSGGFSRVFVARELGYENREVAVKICRQDTHESRTLATLTHSGIGVVHYVRQIPEIGMTAICMPLTSRSTLNDILRRAAGSDERPATASVVWDELRSANQIDSAETPDWASNTFVTWTRDLMLSLAQALAASHAQDIVHCDLKPTNVLVTPEGRPTLVDFNVAFRRNAVVSPANVGGTLPYMAPEQIRAFAGGGFSEIGPPTDVYGLAATIYEVLTGKLPFGAAPPADNGVQSLLERRQVRPESIRAVNPNVSPEFENMILDCLSYEPESRPQNAEELIARLKQVEHASRKASDAGKRFSAARLTIAAAALLAAAAFLPIAMQTNSVDPAADASPDTGLGDTSTDRAEKLVQSLLGGYDAMEAGDLETAELTFLTAMQDDPGHEGATLAWIRTNLRMGNVDAAQRELTSIRYDGSPETAALRGFCLTGKSEFRKAIPEFNKAIEGGLATKELLTDLAYCHYRITQDTEAMEVLDRVRKMDGDTSAADLLLARVYVRVWQRTVRGKPIHKFDTQLLENLIEGCDDSPMKSFVACRVYAMLSVRFGPTDPKAGDEWATRSLSALLRGCELGLSPNYWHNIKYSMPAHLLASDEVKRIQKVAEPISPSQHFTFFVLDPFIGTRLERWTGRKLRPDEDAELNSLVAATR